MLRGPSVQTPAVSKLPKSRLHHHETVFIGTTTICQIIVTLLPLTTGRQFLSFQHHGHQDRILEIAHTSHATRKLSITPHFQPSRLLLLPLTTQEHVES